MARSRMCIVEIVPGWYVALNKEMNAWVSTRDRNEAYKFLSLAKARSFRNLQTRNGKVIALDSKKVYGNRKGK